jgi:hypothetical protein
MKKNTRVVFCLLPVLIGLAQVPSSRAVSNDNFVDAWIISSIPYIINSTNTDATREVGEPWHRGSTVGHTVWWSWTAPTSGPMQINTISSSFAAVIGVYTGTSVSNLTEVASGRGNHVVDFIAVSGVTYRIALDSRDAGAWGSFYFRLLTGGNPPVNDNFTNASVISVGTYSLTGATNSGATWEPGEPAHAGVPGGKSVWWRWTAPTTARYQLDTSGSTLDTLLAVYTGTALTNLSLVASNDNAGPGIFSSLLTFNATAGMNYFFAVDGWQGRSEGSLFNLHLNPQGLTGPCLVSVGGQPHLQFLATPPTGSNIVIQVNTNLNNLSPSDWTSLQTNGSAFLFTDPDPATAPQKFYRAKYQ